MQSSNGGSDQAASVDVSIGEYVRDVLRAELAAEQANQEEIRALEEAGYRIIDGGQTGKSSWDIKDWRSREVIESGTGGYEEFCAAGERLDPDGKWLHIDRLAESQASAMDDIEALAKSSGIPDSLAHVLSDWVGSYSTPDEDVAAVVGWTVDEVHRHRAG